MLTGLFFIILVLVHTNYAGEPPVAKVDKDENTCPNNEYIKEFTMSKIPKGDKTIMNITLEVTQQIPNDAVCECKFYKDDGGSWKAAFELEPGKCCENMLKSDPYKDLEKNQEKIPHSCPIEPGSYAIINYEMDDVDSDDVYGKYRLECKMTGGGGDCLFGKNTEWRICKPEGCMD